MYGCCAPLGLSPLSAPSLALPLRWLSHIHSIRIRIRVYQTHRSSTWRKNTERFFRRLFCGYAEPQNVDIVSTIVVPDQAMMSQRNDVNSGYAASAYSGDISAMTTVMEETIMPQTVEERYTGPKQITNDFDTLSDIRMPQIVITPDLPTRERSSVDVMRFSLPLEEYIIPLSPPPRRRRRWLASASGSQAATDIQAVSSGRSSS
ncbi:uncharacterized protein BT62DRAFT_89588 [Guyanagaster necrorhizus]|uniref:Uncharacterized protein n=1 Tax=Guyanagaster necrorhizus TaxID=856835 RepID=A0A9P7VTU3_9AGAR|nr:uncharacterized protein BT62DRAFT_89588 [Guyanagaster necrorhizus MCA 3950]KAG7446829.1 hypothetical protein BT62DRAFT_89588 [Guyanagaster necrorhizus MCA 3950]